MLPLHGLTIAFVASAGGAFLLPPEIRIWIWIGLGVAYCAMCGYAAVSLRSRILGPCINELDGVNGRIALTFDDGPGERGTPEILDLLAERGVVANFFCIGKHVEARPELVRRMAAEGHLVGNHSYAHTLSLTICGRATLTADLARCQEAISSVLGAPPTMYRPPYGMRSHATDGAAKRHGLPVIGWNTGGGDTKGRTADAVLARIERDLQPGSIVLLHDATSDPRRAVEITRRVLDLIEARGLRAERLDQLLDSKQTTAS